MKIPQMTLSYAEFRTIRFAFAPRNTADGKRESFEVRAKILRS